MSISAGSPGAVHTRHKSVLALLAAYPTESDAKKLIRRLARDKVAYAKRHGWTGPAFCPKIFSSIFDIRCKEVAHDIHGDGRILPYQNGKLWIEYHKDRPIERQRFTIFHEFAHTLFPDFCKFLPLRHNAPGKPADPEKEFENLCDIAASEMLMPIEDISADLAELQRLNFEAINGFGGRYVASIDATTHRVVEVFDSAPCAAVFLTDQQRNRPGGGPLWTKYFCKNGQFRAYLKPGTIPPARSVAFMCYGGQETTSAAKETWWIEGVPRTWLAQARKLPSVPENPDYAKVVVLLLPPGY